MRKLTKKFYQKPALKNVTNFLGKKIIYNSSKGRVGGVIIDVEAYPAFKDEVSHGNKKTERTKVMYQKGGHVYVYLIYGIHYQFSIVVNKEDIPEVIFIRGVYPTEGIDIMKDNFQKEVKRIQRLTQSPGNFCKSFGIDKSLYGEPLTQNKIWLEKTKLNINKTMIESDTRVGIRSNIQGHKSKYRFYLKKAALAKITSMYKQN